MEKIANWHNWGSCRFLLCGEFDSDHLQAAPISYIGEAERQGAIEYPGRVNDVIPQLQLTDCFVLPSFYNEGMNRSMMEAFPRKLAEDVFDVNHVINHYNSIVNNISNEK
jgi:glycosyltransferase involved in cell wall biosynthesis